MDQIAAENLEGLTLQTGWSVSEKILKTAGSTGGNFSVSYLVEKENKECFLKALNFGSILSSRQPNQSIVDLTSEMSKAFQYERDLSNYCKDNKVTKVAFVVDSGEEFVDGYTYPNVPYLIFEKADGDVRKMLNFSNKLDFAWKLKSLHDIAVGLRQLHNAQVSHQDLKPSNILLFNKDSKIGDLGRSMCPALDGPYDRMSFSGDLNYAPPEIIFGNINPSWEHRAYATDCYLLGSLATFYIVGTSMSAIIMNKLKRARINMMHSSDYNSILPYLVHAFEEVLEDIKKQVPFEELKVPVGQLIEYLCYPNPEKRGHPKNIISIGSNYNLERFISKLDILNKRAELLIHKTK